MSRYVNIEKVAVTVTRREFLAGAGALPVLAAIPRGVPASLRLGEATFTTVTDGFLVLPGSFVFTPMPETELARVLAGFGVSADRLEPECNLALYRDGTSTVLFDAGAGPDFMPSAGALVDSLDTAGVAPDEVTHVVFTHAHPDHIWGLIDEFDELVFSEATYMMGRVEWDYWWDPGTVNTIGEARAAFAVGARRRMAVIEDMVERFDDGDEIIPGIAAVATPGHTPGHMGFEIRNGGDAVFVTGDAIGNHHVALARPQWHSGADQDPETAARTRTMLLDRLAAGDMRLAGFHLPGGGIGRITAGADGYRFVQED